MTKYYEQFDLDAASQLSLSEVVCKFAGEEYVYQYKVIDKFGPKYEQSTWYNCSYEAYVYMKENPDQYRTRRLLVMED